MPGSELFVGDELRLTPSQRSACETLNATLALHDVDCLCGSRRFETVAKTDRYGIKQPTVICRACGLIQLNPRMSDADYHDFYRSDAYRLLYDGERFEDYYARLMTPTQGQRILWAVQRAGVRSGSVLEVGAGAGWNLIAFQHAGFSVVGYDLSERLTRLGRRYGVDMRRGSFDAVRGRYDVIILNHVLEHLLDPLAQLRELHELSHDATVLYVGVPRTDYPALSLLQNAHVYYFTDRTLMHYLQRAGWRAERTEHEDYYGMHAVARRQDVPEGVASDLAGEYTESVARLRANRWKVPVIEGWYAAKVSAIGALKRLGAYSAARSIYRRLAG